MATIGEFISYRRKELGLTLNDVGKAVNYTPQAISRFEKDIVQIDLTLVVPLCKVLNISVKSFFNSDIDNIEPYSDRGRFDLKKFDNYLNFLLKEKRVKQITLARTLNLNKNRISNIVRGEAIPSIQEFIEICHFFNVNCEDLYFGKIPPRERRSSDKFGGYFRRGKRRTILIIALISVLTISALSTMVIATINVIFNQNNKNSGQEPGESGNTNTKMYSVKYFYDLSGEEYELFVEKNSFAPRREYYHEGYTLIDYYIGDDLFDFEHTPITRDIIITGRLSKKSFTINYYGFNNELLEKHSAYYLDKDTPPEPPIVDGFKFVGWNSDEYQIVKRDLDIVALYEIDQ